MESIKSGTQPAACSICGRYGCCFTWQNTITRYMGTTTGSVTGADGDNNFVSDYSSIEDLLAAKRDLCIQIGEEGCVLLKNENDALPINKTDKISLFGRNSTDFVVGLSSGGGKYPEMMI